MGYGMIFLQSNPECRFRGMNLLFNRTCSWSMDRWRDRVALVTGGNCGIGAAITRRLLEHGLQVVAVDRQLEALHVLAVTYEGLHPILCDLGNEEEVLSTISWAEKQYGGVDVLINNAGVAGELSLLDGNPKEWRHILGVNVVALNLCTRQVVRSMRRRGVHDGHIVNISSHEANFVPETATLHFYCATKHAVREITDATRRELCALGSGIRVTSISPGLVKSELYLTALGKKVHREVYKNNPSLFPADVADAVKYVLEQPPHVQIHDILMKPM